MTGTPARDERRSGPHCTVDYNRNGITNDHTGINSSIDITSHEVMPSILAPTCRPDGITIAVDPVALITTECITVTSAMRKHARWAHSSVSAILGGAGTGPNDQGSSRLPAQHGRNVVHQRGASQVERLRSSTIEIDDGLVSHWGRRGKKGKSMQDNPLMSAFARLRSDLRGCKGTRAPRRMTDSELINLRCSKF